MNRILSFLIVSKSIVRQFVPPILWNSSRKLWGLAIGSFGSSGIDRQILRSFSKIKKNGFFVEVGANDGLRASNTALLEYRHHWSGILVEPIPHKFQELTQNRSQKNFITCVACVSPAYPSNSVELIYSDTMTIALGLESDINHPEEHALTGLTFIPRERPFRFYAKAETLQSILNRANAPTLIDFLSIDVEGAEIEVLRGIDFARHEFSAILVESRDVKVIESFLKSYGYELTGALSERDYLFKPVSTQ